MNSENLNNPLVTIVIPAYNAEKYLMEAINSVLQQTYSPIELIVVNDGSTDLTEQLLIENHKKYKFFSQENKGQSAAMNFGWEQSAGSLIGYLSADDRLHPEAINYLVKAFLNNPQVVMAYPDFCIIDEKSNYVRLVEAKDYDLASMIKGFDCLPGPGALFRREAWLTTGGWSANLSNIPDLDFYFRLCLNGPFLRVPEKLADFRMHSGSTTYSPSTSAKADEPLQVVHGFFRRNDIPIHFIKWKKRCLASALMLSGFMHGYSGRYIKCFLRIIQASFTSPSSVISRKMANYLIRIFRFNWVKKDLLR